ncbi:MAG: ribose 5-phosphate isomerase [Actinomycetota bacterium]|nr:ribose 5-phosphate isomerase [Actinomycetota bacterium]
MQWDQLDAPTWPEPITNQAAKQVVAEQLAAKANDGDVIGIGSGSTSYLALLALQERVAAEGLRVRCVPTSLEIESYLSQIGLEVTSLVAARPDWCFDGADEIDPEHNLIKGRGGAFVREKLVFAAARWRYILVDESKFVGRLGEKFKLPLAVIPEAANLVRSQIFDLLGELPQVRPAGGKDGGVITEQGDLVMDLAVTGSVPIAELNSMLNSVVGVVGTGLFTGFEFEVIS